MSNTTVEPSQAEEDGGDLAAQVELLAEENRRLRREYVRSRRTNYRRAALGFVVTGGIAAAGGALFPDTRSVLFALAATGVFGAILVYYLSPDRFVAAAVGESVYSAYAQNCVSVVENLGLDNTTVYAPATVPDGGVGVRLFVPQHSSFTVPDPNDLRHPFVVTEDEQSRGFSVTPTGAGLFREFRAAVGRDRSDTPAGLGPQLAEALVELFELVGDATSDIQSAEGRLVVRVSNCEYASVDNFDHPVPSFVATALVVALNEPVTIETHVAGDAGTEYVVSCTWPTNRREM